MEKGGEEARKGGENRSPRCSQPRPCLREAAGAPGAGQVTRGVGVGRRIQKQLPVSLVGARALLPSVAAGCGRTPGGLS